jgi:hypothetical protein
MRKYFLIASFLTMALGATAHGAGKNFGLGFMLGDPTAFSAKLWTSGTTALDFALGWSNNFYGDGYYDPHCNDPDYFNNHIGYCNDRAYARGDRYGYGWRLFHVHADYLFHNFNLIRTSERFPVFYGPGVEFNYLDYSYLQVGVRGDFGIAWMPRRAPMDVFFEIGPGIEIIPYPYFNIDASVGARYYF